MGERDERRCYMCVPIINFVATSDEEAARLIYRAEDALNALGGVDAELTDEVYRYRDDGADHDEWRVPDRDSVVAAEVGERDEREWTLEQRIDTRLFVILGGPRLPPWTKVTVVEKSLLEAEQRAREAAERERDEARDWLGAVNAALGEDRDRRAFVGDAVRLVVAERDAAEAETRRRIVEALRELDRVIRSRLEGDPFGMSRSDEAYLGGIKRATEAVASLSLNDREAEGGNEA